jgi:hypothetical protein
LLATAIAGDRRRARDFERAGLIVERKIAIYEEKLDE